MLILNRKKGEALRVEGPAVIHILRTGVRRASIGIEADRDVRIVRTELEERPKDKDAAA